MTATTTGSPMSYVDIFPKIETNPNLTCQINSTQYMWVIAAEGGWTAADIRFKMVAEVYVVLTLCIFGFIGNAVTIAVLRKDPDRAISSTNWLLQTLALVDTIFLATM